MRGKRTNTADFRTVPYQRYDEIVSHAFYYAILDKLEEVFSDLETEYGVTRRQSAEEAFTYDDFIGNLGMNDELHEALYRMGLDVKRDYSSAWRDDYNEKVKDGIWNNPDSVALFHQDWNVYDSLEEMPLQPFPANASDPTRPASSWRPIPDIRYWEGCPWHRDEDRGGPGDLYKAAVDGNLEMPLFIDIGYYEIYATGTWTWEDTDTHHVTRGNTPVINFRDDWIRLDEVRYMGEAVSTPFDGAVFSFIDRLDNDGRNDVSAFHQLSNALGTFFLACEDAGIAPFVGEFNEGSSYEPAYSDGERTFHTWAETSWDAEVDEGDYAACLDAARSIAAAYA